MSIFFCCQCQANIKSYFLCMTESDQRVKILKNSDGSPRNFTVKWLLVAGNMIEMHEYLLMSKAHNLSCRRMTQSFPCCLQEGDPVYISTPEPASDDAETSSSSRCLEFSDVDESGPHFRKVIRMKLGSTQQFDWIDWSTTNDQWSTVIYSFWFRCRGLKCGEYCDELLMRPSALRTMFRVTAPRVGRDSGPSYFSDLSPMPAETPDPGAARRSRKVVDYFWIPTDEEWPHWDLTVDVAYNQ